MLGLNGPPPGRTCFESMGARRVSNCCGPPSGRKAADLIAEPGFKARSRCGPSGGTNGMVTIPGGHFLMGSNSPIANAGDGEGPTRTVSVSPFLIDARAVTNTLFADFVEDTGYVTDAEKFGWSFVFHMFIDVDEARNVLPGEVPGAPWWKAVAGASWRSPEGPGSDLASRSRHPVVHASWNDASAYALWAGKRLPTEAEWEYAARGGLSQATYAWGDEFMPAGRWYCNIWQGTFPSANTAEDGFVGTAPVGSYPANGYGLYDVAGNVWEWCADWWSTTWHALDRVETRCDPTGPPRGTSKVVRGGSYLCHESYCNRYRVAARTNNTPDSSTGNMGFRCAMDLP